MLKIETANGARWAPLMNDGKPNFTRMESETDQETRRKQDGERRGGVAIMMSAETAKLKARTYGDVKVIEQGRTMALTIRNGRQTGDGAPLTIIGSYLQAAPYDASRKPTGRHDNAKQRNKERNMSTSNARTNNQMAAESVRRVQQQVRRLTEAGHEILWTGDFNVPLTNEDELTRPKGYRFPKSAINIRKEINKMPLRDLHRACHPSTKPEPTHFRHGRIDSEAATRAKLDYCLGTQKVLDATVGASTITTPVRDGKTDHAMVVVEIDIAMVTGSTKPTTASKKPAVGKGAIRALILIPTRELAAQIEESVITYGKYLNLKSSDAKNTLFFLIYMDKTRPKKVNENIIP